MTLIFKFDILLIIAITILFLIENANIKKGAFMKRKLKLALIFMILFGIVGYAIGVGGAYLFSMVNKTTFEVPALLIQPISLIGLGIGAAAGLGAGLFTKKKKNAIGSNKGTDTEGSETEIAFDSKFISSEEMKKDKDLLYSTWKDLPSLNETGFVFRMKNVGGKYEVNMKPETHALVIGTTGVGKTQLLANPTIRILAHSGQKPSMVVTDPKGELYADNAAILKEEGYETVVLNLNDPYSSAKWNPMEIAYRTYQRAGNLASEVKKFSNCTPEDMGYTKFDESVLRGVQYGDSWYGFEKKAFPTKELLEAELHSRKVQLEDEAKSDLRNIALTLIPDDPNAKDKTWPDGCRDLITGIMYAMLEDSRDERLGMTIDKFNFFNLYKIAMRRDPAGDRESALKTLAKYAEGRDEINGNVKQLMSGVCLASGVTQKSFLSTLSSSVGKILGDDGILHLTSGTDIDFTKIPDKPTVFFIRIPDHKTERHPLGVLCISQLYKVLVDVANKTVDKKGKSGALSRPVYFILDEFGNMPAVPNFGTMVTVSRSRKIFFEIILQSYTQLDIKYGPDEAKNIKGNFQMEVFLGSEDPTTIQAFSEACGETTVFHEEENISENTKDTSQGKNVSKSIQRTRKPLIDKQQLRLLEKWTIVAKIFRKSIMKDVMTPFFDTDCMIKKTAKEPMAISKPLDAQAIFYDIDKRNAMVLRPKSPFED